MLTDLLIKLNSFYTLGRCESATTITHCHSQVTLQQMPIRIVSSLQRHDSVKFIWNALTRWFEKTQLKWVSWSFAFDAIAVFNCRYCSHHMLLLWGRPRSPNTPTKQPQPSFPSICCSFRLDNPLLLYLCSFSFCFLLSIEYPHPVCSSPALVFRWSMFENSVK